MAKLIVSVLFGIIYAFRFPESSGGNAEEKGKAMSHLLNKLLDSKRYDSRLRPSYGDSPVVVTVGFWILSIEKLDVVNMDFTVDLFLRQQWTDKRLDHGLNQTISLNRPTWKRIWLPDSYFVNAKTAKMHKVTAPNVMLMIAPAGIVKYNARVTIKAACPVDLRKFPMDIQVCPLDLESYGYDNKHIKYKWEVAGTDGKTFIPSGVRLTSSYMLTNISLSLIMNQYVVGNFSGVRAEFTFKRSYSYFLSHMYGTSSVIVAISWIGFVVPLDHTAARIALGITSLLTEVTILNMMNNSMPKVSYVKSSDEYLIGCFVFVFFTLVEYCAVLLLKSKQKQKNNKAAGTIITSEAKNQEKLLAHTDAVNGICLTMAEASTNCQPLNTALTSSENLPEIVQPKRHDKQLSVLTAFVIASREKILTDGFILRIDEYSLKIFPVAFAMYNAFYWMDYL